MKNKKITILKLLIWITLFILIAPIDLYAMGSRSKNSSNHESLLNQKSPSFSLEALDGTTITLDELKDKVVVLNFWATWCPPCVAEIPHLIDIQKDYSEDLQVIGVSFDESIEDVKEFRSKKDIHYPIAMSTPDIVQSFGHVRSIPTTFIIDKDGFVRDIIVGYHSKKQFMKVISPHI